MGYTTDFMGKFTIDRPVDDETAKLLIGLARTRRMARRVDKKYGVDGEFYVDGKGYAGQGEDPNIIDHNRPPRTQPSLWCQWELQEDHQTIQWDSGEKFYHYIEWIKYLIDKILKPRGYVVNGKVSWHGEDFSDIGIILVDNNVVDVKYGTISVTYE